MGRFSQPTLTAPYARTRGEARYPWAWDGLVGFWTPLSHDGVARDWSNLRYHGTFNGGMESAVPSLKGLAWEFDGSGDYIDVTAALRGSLPMTFCAWVKTSDSGVNGVLLQGDSGSAAKVGLEVTATFGFVRYQSAASSQNILGTIAINDDEWHHIAAVFAGAADRKLYVDGKLDGTNTNSLAFPTCTNLEIGRQFDSSPSNLYAGLLKDVAIYNHALPVAWIGALADGASPLIRLRKLVVAVPSAIGDITGSSTLTFGTSGDVAGTGTIGGSSTLTFGQSGAVAGTGDVTGSTTLTFTATGNVVNAGAVTGPVSGSSTLTFTVTALVRGCRGLACCPPDEFGYGVEAASATETTAECQAITCCPTAEFAYSTNTATTSGGGTPPGTTTEEPSEEPEEGNPVWEGDDPFEWPVGEECPELTSYLQSSYVWGFNRNDDPNTLLSQGAIDCHVALFLIEVADSGITPAGDPFWAWFSTTTVRNAMFAKYDAGSCDPNDGIGDVDVLFSGYTTLAVPYC